MSRRSVRDWSAASARVFSSRQRLRQFGSLGECRFGAGSFGRQRFCQFGDLGTSFLTMGFLRRQRLRQVVDIGTRCLGAVSFRSQRLRQIGKLGIRTLQRPDLLLNVVALAERRVRPVIRV